MKSSSSLLALLLVSSPSVAEPVSFSFSGQLGVGWLDRQGISSSARGYTFDGWAAVLDADAATEISFSDTVTAGAVARIFAQGAVPSRYAITYAGRVVSDRGDWLDDITIDLAAYVSLGPLSLSYGEMESSFGFATIAVSDGDSPLSAGNAVLMNIGAGSGSRGVPVNNSATTGVHEFRDFTTIRADLRLGDFIFSRSSSSSEFIDANSTGVTWSKSFGDFLIDVGFGLENSSQFDYRSRSASLRYRGLKITISEIEQRDEPLAPGQGSSFDITYLGKSISYSLGSWELGFSLADQRADANATADEFVGDARAFWFNLDIDESSRLHFEISRSDFERGVDVEAMSFAYSYRF